ncbi:MAG: type II toxin-antitoxin system HicB family antitoxin [Proteobacteria bacterium]|jgi:predicted RNase H-like HicB family nuclease|nr:type II toxin-antitoxin system HicB family antitoxin [Pseudomonadota bacterium]
MRSFSVLVEQDEDGVFIAHVPSLPGCHTQGASLVEVERRIKEAIRLYLDVAKKRRTPIQQHRFVGAHMVEVA